MLQAARDLHTLLHRFDWFARVEARDERLCVLVHRMPTMRERANQPREFAGYPVAYEYMPTPTPDEGER